MDKSLLDTDILSEVLKGKNPTVAKNSNTYRNEFGRFTISTMTVVEMVKGLKKKGREDRIEALLKGLRGEEVLSLDLDAAVLAGKIYADLEMAGQTIGRADPIIAAIGLSRDLVLVTGNTEHFERIASLGYSLRLDNWRIAI